MIWRGFSGFVLSPLGPVDSNVNATAYSVVATACGSLVLFLHEHKIIYRKTRCDRVGVRELQWPAQTPDLKPTKCLWDELELDCEPGLLVQHQCLTSQMLF